MKYTLQNPGCAGMMEAAIEKAMDLKRPLYLPIIATKPCFIKMASLIQSMTQHDLPFLLVNSNQHYDQLLTAQIDELGYKQQIGANLYSNGRDFNERIITMCQSVTDFLSVLATYTEKPDIIPVVSGDTFSAGILPQLFYFSAGARSVHVEAGLRSYGPADKDRWQDGNVLYQAGWDWTRYVNDPFPEGMDSRLASISSELLLAPVKRNMDNLLYEGYVAENIMVTGSLSSDAVELMKKYTHTEDFLDRYPFLSGKKWLRVDLHRRENLIPDRLIAVLSGIARLSGEGMNILLVKSNAMMAAIHQFGLEEQLRLTEQAGVKICELWPSYLDVISFMLSDYCLGLYTDSGGLQEEAHILRVPCLTLRYSTDRPETILDAGGNLLLPPVSEKFICHNTLNAFDNTSRWAHQDTDNIYGNKVADLIVEKLKHYTPQYNAARRMLTY
ncbi:UDP-N-acetylglucosamine 2-epimerase [Chitinophaga sp. HK235]|uniref:UDP-N-acetylglucosamine 2-epimerase n=1 Tax=Chitinophaga sp. HK235 TaxID=2952571 RepID=UPI001BA5D5C6|nr:UDP-N-acetylglucosamine 2-epimerase [Chitinophaga sp. HK235]